jgi:hypothetical protein
MQGQLEGAQGLCCRDQATQNPDWMLKGWRTQTFDGHYPKPPFSIADQADLCNVEDHQRSLSVSKISLAFEDGSNRAYSGVGGSSLQYIFHHRR